MSTVSVVYFSDSGHTQLMAECVANGAEQVDGTTVHRLRITGEKITQGRWQDDAIIEQLNQSDAIIFGSPTYLGSVAAQFKDFIDAASSIWFQKVWKHTALPGCQCHATQHDLGGYRGNGDAGEWGKPPRLVPRTDGQYTARLQRRPATR